MFIVYVVLLSSSSYFLLSSDLSTSSNRCISRDSMKFLAGVFCFVARYSIRSLFAPVSIRRSTSFLKSQCSKYLPSTRQLRRKVSKKQVELRIGLAMTKNSSSHWFHFQIYYSTLSIQRINHRNCVANSVALFSFVTFHVCCSLYCLLPNIC